MIMWKDENLPETRKIQKLVKSYNKNKHTYPTLLTNKLNYNKLKVQTFGDLKEIEI